MALRSGSSNRSNSGERRALSCAVAAWALSCGVGEVACAQCQYSVTVVEGEPCGIFGVSVHFFGLNDLGQACGEMAVCGTVSDKVPIVWTEELGLIELPLPEGATGGVANDINNVLGSDGFGQVACTLVVPSAGGDRPYLYDDGAWTPLGLLPGAQIGRAWALNDAGDVVGGTSSPGGGTNEAFLWNQGVLTAIDLPIGPKSYALDVSEKTAVVGLMGQSKTAFALGFLHQDGFTEEIPAVSGGNSSEARGVNFSEVVTGQSLIPVKNGSVPRRSWVYQNGQLVDLGGFADTHRTISEGINDARQIVGSCFTQFGGETSFLWQDGELIRLDDLFEMPPGVGGLSAVKAINNRGQIAGHTGGTAKGIILTPIDVPLGDVDFDCEVDGWDLALLLGDWGACAESGSCLTDMVSSETFQPPPDGIVDGADLAVLLGSWTQQTSSTSSGRN